MGNSNRQAFSPGGSTNLPSRSFRYLQDQYKNGNAEPNGTIMTTTTTVEETVVTGEGTGLRRGSDAHVPSRSFKFLQDQYHAQQTGTNNREDLVEIYNKRTLNDRSICL